MPKQTKIYRRNINEKLKKHDRNGQKQKETYKNGHKRTRPN